MKKRVFSRSAVMLIAIISLLSCDRYPDPESVYLRNYYFGFQNPQQQKYDAGESIDVVFMANNSLDRTEDSLKVIFEVVWGGGSITKQVDYTNNSGIVNTRWTLGTVTTQQKLSAKTYDKSGKLLTTSELIEYGFISEEWNKISGDSYGNIVGMAADTINDITLMVSNSTIYKQGARYYDWVPIQSTYSPRTINIDKNGIFYVSSYDGTMVKSTDHGNSWQTCAKPYSDLINILSVRITSDNYIWVFSWNRTVRFSKDGGDSWEDVASGMANGLGDIFRMKDGSLLYHGSDCCSLYRSKDETQTWQKIETPGYSARIYVDGNDKITLLENGVNIYNSTDYGATFTKVHSIAPAYNSWDSNVFNKWSNIYFVFISGFGILKSHDLTVYQDYWYNSDVRNLFIDHNGNLFATDFTGNTYYKKNTEAR